MAGLPSIPGFEIIDRIGFGGFATVYRARQPSLDRTVAIKVVHRTRDADDETLRRFRRECQAIGSLTGTPAVMTVFDLGTTAEGDPYLVLEFLDGGSLQDELEASGRFEWPSVVEIARGLATALRAAHRLGILHRDIKPANVLRDSYGNIRLGDFGIAHLAGSSDSTTGDTAMTISYAAPEMLQGKRATPASDFYSLGTLMYTLLNGRPPFSRPDDNSVAAVISRITMEPAPPLPGVVAPRDVAELIEALMAKDRVFRPDAGTLIARLDAIVTEHHGMGGAPVGRVARRPDARRSPRAPGDGTTVARSAGSSAPGHPLSPRPGQRGDDADVAHGGGDGHRGTPSEPPPVRRTPSFSATTVDRSRRGDGKPGVAPPATPVEPSHLGTPGGRRHDPAGLFVDRSADRSLGLSGSLGRAVFDSGLRGRHAVGGLGYAVDIVFVIDITASMWPVLGEVKRHALGFHDRLTEIMAAKGKHVSRLRVRLVAYRDYLDFADDAMVVTPFFDLATDAGRYEASIADLRADGGGDEPESGLEALAIAMASPWERGMDRRRHVIVLCTDASAHPLEASVGRMIPGYPPGIPNSFDALTDQWSDPGGTTMEYAAKRLLLYAPDVYPWNLISTHWDSVLHFPSRAGTGLDDVGFAQIVHAIAGSV